MRSAISLRLVAVALTLGLASGVLAPTLARAQDFTRGLTAEERAAIGLAKLSPEERAALVAVVERYRASAPASTADAGRATATSVAAKVETSATVESAPRTEAPAAAVTSAKSDAPSAAAGGSRDSSMGTRASSAVAAAGRTVRSWIPFVNKDGAGKAPTPKPEAAAATAAPDEVVTRLKGELRSFNGRRSFVLENGEVWEMDETAGYSGPVLTAPEVILRPGILGTHVLKIPDAALRVRVRRAGSR